MLHRAFTLVELLVTVGIIALLASTVVVNVSRSRSKARDARRKADLKSIQTALEAYNDENGVYPTTGGVFRYEASTGYSGSTGYVPNIAPTFMAILPSDPAVGRVGAQGAQFGGGQCSSGTAGYHYKSDGSEYKVIAQCTIETAIAVNDPFRDPQRPGWVYALYSGGGVTY